MSDLLDEIERYCDAVPRRVARTETLGPFTLFVNPGAGMPYYARPSLGATSFTPADVTNVLERQHELGVPRAFEWVDEMTPALAVAIEAAGVGVHRHPLLVLDPASRPVETLGKGVQARFVTPEDDVALHSAVAAVGFAHAGGPGEQGIAALLAAARSQSEDAIAVQRRRLAEGLQVMAAAYADGHPVAAGSHQPVDGVSEVVGVATLPAYRRRGLASAVVSLLIDDVLDRGMHVAFLSAADEDAARIYERLGFRRCATACIAEAED